MVVEAELLPDVDAREAFRVEFHRIDHIEAARERMIEAFFEWHAHGRRVALVSGTNAEADAINDAIQRRRVDACALDAGVAA